jgi:hypothetical protein
MTKCELKLCTQQQRKFSGQAIVEGAALMVVLVPLVVILTFMLVNASIVGTYAYRLNAIASESSRQYNAGKWWLGMERTGFNVPAAQQDVKDLVNAEIAASGWPEAKADNFQFDYTAGMMNNQPITVLRVSFDVSGLKVLSAGVFPSTVKIHATGISSDAEYAVARHGMVVIHTVGGKSQRAIRIPAYNATIGRDTPAHPDFHWLHAGPSIGTSPVINFNIKCDSSGVLNIQDTTADGRSHVGPSIVWNDPAVKQ